jgi:hypothetical protein
VDAAVHTLEDSSPFAAASLGESWPAAPGSEISAEYADTPGLLASPFAQGAGYEHAGADRLEVLLAELEDDEFDDTVESLVDAAAARHLSMLTRPGPPDVAEAEVESWLGGLAEGTDRVLAELEARYADTPAAALTEHQVDDLLAEHEHALDTAGEQFLGGIVGKALRAAGSLAGKAVSAVGGLLPLGRVFALVRRLVKPLLRRVLRTALGRLPAPVRGIAAGLATKYGLSEADTDSWAEQDGSGTGGLAAEFDQHLAEAMLASTEAGRDDALRMAEAAAEAPVSDPLTVLDTARERLVAGLLESEPGQAPVAQVEQFIPAVMAAMPLLRAGLKIVGRDRVKRVLADGIAALVRDHVGADAARTLAPHVAEAGLRLLSLETGSPEQAGAEALAGVVEDTVRSVASLPAEYLDDPVLLHSELEDAFEAAAARQLPASRLRQDLGAAEHEPGEGVWLPMPRGGGPLRCRRFSRGYDVMVTRPAARAVLLGEDTLEERLLDAGVRTWPVPAEVHLFETLPGGRAGHVAAFEGPDVVAEEFEELTPVTAAVLLGRPGLAGFPRRGTGVRLFRVVTPGMVVRRRIRRVSLRLVAGEQPVLRAHLRLGERLSHSVAEALAGDPARGTAAALALVRATLHDGVRRSVAARLARVVGRVTGAAVPPDRAGALAQTVLTGMVTTLSANLAEQKTALAEAARNPAPGVTLTFEWRFADRAALRSGVPAGPVLTIAPGVRRG